MSLDAAEIASELERYSMENAEPVWDQNSRLYWPTTESIDRCWGYMLNRVCDVDVLVKHTRTRCVVVQAGGFVGIWPRRLARTFEVVYTFEPMPHVFRALAMNTRTIDNIVAENCALSNADKIAIEFHRSGCSRVVEGAPLRPARTIDSLNLTRCDAIYLDVEKHEVTALEGAEETIKRFSPTLMLETHPDRKASQDKWIAKHGYEEVASVHSDRVFNKRGKK